MTRKLWSAGWVASLAVSCLFAILAGLEIGRCMAQDDSGRVRGFGSFGPLSAQGGAPVTSFAGVIDPTNAAFAGGMVASSSSSPSAGILTQNAAAFVAAAAYASAHNVTLYLPPGRYPANDIDLGGVSNLTVLAYNVTLARAGDASGSDTALLRIHNGSHVRISGVTFSQRDLANTDANDVLVKIGDGGSTVTDDVQLIDDVFVEGHGGDCVRMDGGASATTVTRITMTRDRFEGCGRAGVDVRPGTARILVTWSWFKGNPNRDVYFEAAADFAIGQAEITGNTFDRTGSTTAQAVTIAGNGTTTNNEQTQVKYNRVLGGVIEGTNLGRASIVANYVIYDVARGSTANIDLSGTVYDTWVEDNYLRRESTSTSGSLVRVVSSGSAAPKDVWIRGNRLFQYTGTNPGIDVSGAARITALENDITYNSEPADSGSTGFVGIACAGGATQACSGVFSRNRVKQDVLVDGTSPAGRMLAGIQLLKGSQTTIGRATLRDNVVDGAQAGLWLDATGSSQYPEGFPVLSGNFVLNSGGDIAGGVLTYRTETTADAETVSTGALDPAKHTSFITTSGTKAYTQADGVVDGFTKCQKITAATSTPAGTLTPTHFADGTIHTLTWNAVGGYACEQWDATNTTWRLLGSSGVTLN